MGYVTPPSSAACWPNSRMFVNQTRDPYVPIGRQRKRSRCFHAQYMVLHVLPTQYHGCCNLQATQYGLREACCGADLVRLVVDPGLVACSTLTTVTKACSSARTKGGLAARSSRRLVLMSCFNSGTIFEELSAEARLCSFNTCRHGIDEEGNSRSIGA